MTAQCGERCECHITFVGEPEQYVSRAPSGVLVFSEVPVDFTDDWFRFGYLSFFFESYRMWSYKLRDAFRKKPVVKAAAQTEQEQGKVGTL